MPKNELATRRMTVDLSPADFDKLTEMANSQSITKREALIQALRLMHVLLQQDDDVDLILRDSKGNETRLLIV